ncbi:MAG: SGNH/GDSL hydrolase family protein [Planctomycetes bacterium]|nr:SGNH/GDSL hydrolase family protein [Planctomycetota bacterium]
MTDSLLDRLCAGFWVPGVCAALWVLACAGISAAEGPSFIKNLEAGRPQTIVTYGTSLTASSAWPKLFEALLNKKFPGLAKFVNGAASGMWSDWGVKNLDAKVLAANPDAVFIEFGINDAVTRFNATTEIARGNLENMIDRIQKQRPACQIVLLTMNCASGEAEARRGNKTAEFYQVYRDVAKARNLLLIDLYPVWKDLLDKQPDEFKKLVPDLLHPSKEGSEKVTLPALAAAFNLPTATGK